MVAGPDAMLKVTVKPDEAIALTENGALPYVLFGSAPKVISWLALATVKLRSMFAAASWLPSPLCDARSTTVPAPVIVTVLLTIVAGPETMLKPTARFDEAVAL